MSISAVQPQPTQVAAQLTAFKGEGEEKKGTGLFLPLAAGLATGGVTYYLGSKPTADTFLKLGDEGVDKFISSTSAITDDALKTHVGTLTKPATEGAAAPLKDLITKIKAGVADGADAGVKDAGESAKGTIKAALEGLGDKLPKIRSIKTAAIWGGVALAGTYILAKIFGGKKEA